MGVLCALMPLKTMFFCFFFNKKPKLHRAASIAHHLKMEVFKTREAKKLSLGGSWTSLYQAFSAHHTLLFPSLTPSSPIC